jgi:predicted DNA-binding transcriptional regulator YafY
MLDDPIRQQAKRDRLARFYRVLTILHSHRQRGVRIDELARRLGVSRRTAYRDLQALEREIGIPVWNQAGRWGVDDDAFLPPLQLTVGEAMAIVLAARLMVRYADKYHPELAAAFEKLEVGLPPALREHVERTLDVMARRRVDETFSRHVRLLTRAWAERRTVTFDYAPARYGPEREPRQARVRPYLLEPSGLTHALYLIGFDETRGAMRTFKVERIRDLILTPETFARPEETVIEEVLGRAWDIIADQPLVDVVLRFSPEVAARVNEATWHPSQRVSYQPDGSLLWRATVSGTLEIRLWILSWGPDVEVLEPPTLRQEIAATLRQTLARYEGSPR